MQENGFTALGIRACAMSDLEAVGAFYDRVVAWLNAHVNYPRWVSGIYPSESSARKMALRGEQYMAVYCGRVVGAFALNDDPQGNYGKGRWSRNLKEGEYMVIHALATEPSLHGRGIARSIIGFCVDRAKALGYKALRLDTIYDNAPARRLYEKYGFSYAGDADLEHKDAVLPPCSMYELNW